MSPAAPCPSRRRRLDAVVWACLAALNAQPLLYGLEKKNYFPGKFRLQRPRLLRYLLRNMVKYFALITV